MKPTKPSCSGWHSPPRRRARSLMTTEREPLEGGNYTVDHTAGVYLRDAEGEFIGMLDSHEPRETQLQKLRRLAGTAG